MIISINNKDFQVNDGDSLENIIKKNFKKIILLQQELMRDYQDLSECIKENSKIELITTEDKDGIDILRHSCAHIFGHAIKQLYPNTKMVIGPVIENGFYYDILSDNPLTEKDLPIIENRMRKLAKKNYEIRERLSQKRELFLYLKIEMSHIRLIYLKKYLKMK